MAPYRTTLTADFVRSALDYDPLTGEFRWKHRHEMPPKWNTKWAGKCAGFTSSEGYLHITLTLPHDRSAYSAGRLAWLITHGTWPPHQIDHINGVRSDNRLTNLRLADNGENNRNRGAQSNNICGHRGISRYSFGRWRARIAYNGKQYELGVFSSLEEAITARKKAEAEVHGRFAPTIEHRYYTRTRKQVANDEV